MVWNSATNDGQRQRRRFDAKNARTQADGNPTRVLRHQNLRVREPALGPNGDGDAPGPLYGWYRLTAEMAHQSFRRQFHVPTIARPIRQRPDLHQHISAALLACFDDGAFEFVEPCLPRMDDAAFGPQRHESGYPQFRQLFEEEVAPVAFGQRGGDFQAEVQFPLRAVAAGDINRHLFFVNFDNQGLVFCPVSVEQGNGVAGASAKHRGKMVGFGTDQIDWSNEKRAIDIKPIGHVW